MCIELPNEEVNFELKSGLIHLLPTFRGLAGEDPYKHLKEFHVVCSSMEPQGVTVDQIKMRAFPFSLTEKAKDWLYYLPPGSITTWNELKRRFLEKVSLPLEPQPLKKRSVGFINKLEKLSMNIGRGSINCVQAVLTTKFQTSF